MSRSRARRRAEELHFVPASSRAKRISLGALVALTAGPTAGLADGGLAQARAATTTPTTTSEHQITLTTGSRGGQVQRLQKALGIEVDGIYGPETEAAVRQFQASHGLEVDNIVGPKTSAALAGRSYETTSGTIVDPQLQDLTTGAESGLSESPATLATAFEVPVAEPAGEELQAQEIEASEPEEPSGETPEAVEPASDPDEVESEAVGAIAPTGGLEIAGQTEQTGGTTAISAEGVAAAVQAPASTDAAEAPAEESATEAVMKIQAALDVEVDGDFGPVTEAAVRQLQANSGIQVDGVVGPETWKALGFDQETTVLVPPASALPRARHRVQAAVTHAPAATPVSAAPAAPAAPGRHLPSAVTVLQQALHVEADGEFGPATEAAVKEFQERSGIEVDGVVGPETWSALGIPRDRTLKPDRALFPHNTAGSSSGATSSSAEGVVAEVIAAANEIATTPYIWGGGHGSFESPGYDCSGSVSYALHGGGLLSVPEDSTELESYGEPGPGRYITIYANAEHAWMTIDGRRFDTVALAEDGTRWSDTMESTEGFVVRHPAGY